MSGISEIVGANVSSVPLAGQTLAEYFANRPRRRRAPHNVLLVFDQFEEVLTVEPLAVAAKRELFDQLGDLLRNWDLESGKTLAENAGKGLSIDFADTDSGDALLAAGTGRGNVFSWRLSAQGEHEARWTTPDLRPARRVRLSPDRGTLATAVGRNILLWDLTSPDPTQESPEFRVLEGHSGDVRALLFRDRGETLIACDEDGQILFWDVAAGRERDRLAPLGDASGAVLRALAQSSDERLLAASGGDATGGHRYIHLRPHAFGADDTSPPGNPE